MLDILYPDIYINSVYDLDYKYLIDKGLTNIIMDIDNTLSCWGSKEPETAICNLVNDLRDKGFNICILSNSSNKRVKNYCSGIDVVFAVNAIKPFKYSFMKAMTLMNSNKHNTCVVGDQLFTDILGGNYCGLYTIMVSPINKKEFIFTQLMRKIEKHLLKDYKNVSNNE